MKHPQATEEYLAALAVGDRLAAMATVRELRANGVSALEIMTEVIAAAQFRVGELWAMDAWSVSQEHAATAVSESVLSVLATESEVPDTGDAPVVVSCVEQEWHALPAHIIAEYLRGARLPVSYLGANASSEHLVRHIHDLGPRAVALSCSLGGSLVRVRRHIEAIRETGTPVIVGGAAFDRHGHRAEVLGATAYAVSGDQAVEVIRDLPSAVSPAEPLTAPGAGEAFVIHADRETLSRRVVAQLEARQTPPAGTTDARWLLTVSEQLPHVVGALAGALLTDDETVLQVAFAWFGDVLRHRGAPAQLEHHLHALLAAEVREHPHAVEMLVDRAPPTQEAEDPAQASPT